MNTFGHFLLTRFNAPLKSGEPSSPSAKPQGLDAAWLARRFDLFERICLASLQRQTEGAFQWLVFLDWGMPVSFKERMAALTVRHEFLHPVYCSQFDEETVLAEIRRRETAGRSRITTRLDVASALHPRMVERIRELARLHSAGMDLQKGFWIRFPVGCTEKNGDFYIRRDPLNSFSSFMSAAECSQTALGADASSPVVDKVIRPMWCQVIHDDTDTLIPNGVYWPWGGCSEFAPVVTNGFCRGFFWQCIEVARSAARYGLRRG